MMSSSSRPYIMETLQKTPISEMLLRCWGRTLAKNGITLEPTPEGPDQLEAFLVLWDSSPEEN